MIDQKALCRDVMQESFAHVAFLGYMSRLRKHARLAERIMCEENILLSRLCWEGKTVYFLPMYLFARDQGWRAMLGDVKYSFLW